MKKLTTVLKEVQALNDQKQYQQTIDLLTDDLLEKHQSADLYAEKALAYRRLDLDEESNQAAEQALAIDEKNAKALHYKGTYYSEQKEYSRAIEYYNKAIEINPEFEYSYYGLGNIYLDQKEYDKAIEKYKKAIEINPKSEYYYYNLGVAFRNQKKYIEAVKAYDKVIEINPKYNNPYYGLGLIYSDLNQHFKALKSFKKYLSLSKSDTDYYPQTAQAKIEELQKLIKVPSLSEARALVDQIKSLLKFKKGTITHYTSLTVARLLILENSSFRLSEGAFLNDTSEGKELFKFLSLPSASAHLNNMVALSFIPKPFIGSFVADDKHNDLTLWRMYGKEGKDEARGCSITIDMAKLIDHLIERVMQGTAGSRTNKMEEEFSFYRVAYKKGGASGLFHIPGVGTKAEKELNEAMTKLIDVVSIYNEKESPNLPNLIEILNEIAFLFKSAEYQYEHEVRLVINGVGFEKNIESSNDSPRVYIDLVPIRSLIKKITLGPKVEKAEEWAATFYYDLQNEDLSPEISISYLPYK